MDITLVGEFNVDLLLYGLPEELPLERELLADSMALMLGGSPAITAHNLAALGSRVGFIAPMADDMFSRLCFSDLTSAGVDLSRIVPAPVDVNTGITVLLQHVASRRTLTYPGATATLRYCDLDLDYLKRARHFHLASPFLQRQLIEDVPRLFAHLKEAGLTISLDTNDDPTGQWSGSIRDALEYVDILMPNEREACALAGEGTLSAAIEKLLQFVPLLVVKRATRGAIACSAQHRESVPALAVQSIDAVGAGDSFNAGFLHGHLQGWPLKRCLELGNLAGALSTTAIGGTAAFRNDQAMHEFFAKNGKDVYRRCC